jgi:hypothetical protein
MSERRADIIVKGLTLDEAEEFIYWFSAEGAIEFSSWLADTLKEEGKEDKDIREEIHMNDELTYPPTPKSGKESSVTEDVFVLYID